jgi:hypothetical protein
LHDTAVRRQFVVGAVGQGRQYAMSDEPALNREIERQILAILYVHPKLTFTSLAEAVPEHRWRELFGALNRLRKRHQVDLSALPLDYEVVLRKPATCRQKR